MHKTIISGRKQQLLVGGKIIIYWSGYVSGYVSTTNNKLFAATILLFIQLIYCLRQLIIFLAKLHLIRLRPSHQKA